MWMALLLLSLTGCAMVGQQFGRGFAIGYRFQQGVTAYRTQQYAAAARDFSAVIALNPQYELAYEWRAVSYIGLHDFRSAVADYDQALFLLNDAGAPRARRSTLLERRAYAKSSAGDFAGAIRDDTAALSINPDDSYLYLNRAWTYSNHQDYAKAIADLSLILRKDPQFTQALRQRASTYGAAHDYSDAIADDTSILDSRMTDAPALNERCWYRTLAGSNLQLALNDCNAALRLHMTRGLRAATLQSRSLTYFKLRQFDNSLADCNASLALARMADTLYVRSLVERALNNAENAQRDASEALALDPKIVETYAGYGLRR
jgi:tetratricopeptide (TPR) repeat protein